MKQNTNDFWKQMFEYRGRIGRLRYFLTALGFSAFYGLCVGVVQAIAGHAGSPIVAVAFIAIAVVLTFAAIKRAHDFDASGWWTVLLWVPVINFVWGLVLLFRKGTTGPNRFDEAWITDARPLGEPALPVDVPAADTGSTLEAGLAKLKKLHDDGLLSAEAYAAGQARLIRSVTESPRSF
ncbi:DUF805 domain-containing protein [Caballeronia sordidicola]|uniref:DUF805 domain-containing protein n=1 Tax=Caballeronia sordidicola TaxID=196367 RepID=UPI00094DA1A3|nr:DUF805 domain-containing protein [Caballeronia sordidicola]